MGQVRIMDNKCKYDNCESVLFKTQNSGKHIKLSCAECGRYQQFLPQGEEDTGEIASEKQQEYALDLLRAWKRRGEPMTAQQAAAIIKAFKVK